MTVFGGVIGRPHFSSSIGSHQPNVPIRPIHRRPIEPSEPALITRDEPENVTDCQVAMDLVNSPTLTLSTFQCLAKTYHQVSVGVTRLANCSVDDTIVETVQSALSAGFLGVDLIIPPAPVTCDIDPGFQVLEVLSLFESSNVPISHVWFDVKAATGLWQTACEENLQWLGPALRHAARELGPSKVGLRTNSADWTSIMCGSQQLAQVPMWYQLIDQQPNMNDWGANSFGGWQQPVAKQYATSNTCGVAIAADYRMGAICQ